MNQFKHTGSSETLPSACVIKLRVGRRISWFTPSIIGFAIASDPLDPERTVASEIDEDKSILDSGWEACIASSSSLVTVKLTELFESWTDGPGSR